MKAKTLTPLQINFLRLFSVDSSDEFVLEIKRVLNDHFQKKIDNEFDRLFQEGKLSMEIINSWTNEGLHEELRNARNGKACEI